MSDTEKLSKFELELVHKLRGNPHLHDALNRIIAAHGAEPQQDKEEA